MIVKDCTVGTANVETGDDGPNIKISDEVINIVRIDIRSFQSSTLIVSDQKGNYLYPRFELYAKECNHKGEKQAISHKYIK